MGWEQIKGRSSGFGCEPIPEDEISIVSSANGNSIIYKCNVHPRNFPDGTKQCRVMVDREKGKIGFFTPDPKDLFANKGICAYGKQKLAYISLPKFIADIGFVKGRYKILHPKEENKEMFFYISKNKRGEDPKKIGAVTTNTKAPEKVKDEDD